MKQKDLIKSHISLTLFILIVILQINIIDCAHILDLPIDSDFGQEKAINRIIAQQGEEIKVDLRQHFRGQLLKFQIIPQDQIQERLINQSIVRIQPPVVNKAKIEFKNSVVQKSIVYHSQLVFIDSWGNSDYLIIDDQLNLYIYKISDSFYKQQDFQSQVNISTPIYHYNLYNEQEMSPERSCSHLLPLSQKQTFMLTCLTKSKTLGEKSNQAVIVLFTLNEVEEDRFSIDIQNLFYVHTDINYKEIQVGKMAVLNTTSHETVDILVLKRKSSKDLEIITLNLTGHSSKTKQVFTEVSYQNFVNDTFTNKDLSLIDISVVDEHNGFVLLCDFITGLFSVQITCSEFSCQMQTLSYLKLSNAGQIKLPQSQNFGSNQFALLQVIQPFEIHEININDKWNIYTQRIYRLKTDENCLGMKVIDANEKYIVSQYLRLKDLKPLIRVYERKASYFSIAIEETEYTDVYVEGDSIDFLKFNHFILKSGNTLNIYEIGTSNLIVNTQNYTVLDELDNFYQIIMFKFIVTDLKNQTLKGKIELVFLPLDANETFRVLMDQEPQVLQQQYKLDIRYNCGQFANQFTPDGNNEFILINIDSLFQGQFTDLVIEPQEGYENFNFLDFYFPDTTNVTSLNQNFQQCQNSQIVQFKTNGYIDFQLACVMKNQFKIVFIDIIDEGQEAGKVRNITEFNLGEVTIKTSIVDNNSSSIYVFTDKNRKGFNKITCHVFRLYNQLAWEKVIKLGELFPNILNDFTLDNETPVVINTVTKHGVFKSIKDSNNKVQLLMFEIKINQEESEEFYFKSSLFLNLQKQSKIQHLYITQSYVWILYSNNTFANYEMIYYKNGDYDYLTRKVSDIHIVQSSSEDDFETKVWNFYLTERYIILFIGRNQVQTFLVVDDEVQISTNKTLRLSYENENYCKENYQFIHNALNKTVVANYQNYIFVLFQDLQTSENKLGVFNIEYHKFDSYIDTIVIPQELIVDKNYIKLHILELSKGFVQVVVVSVNASVMFKISIDGNLYINQQKARFLDQMCKETDEEIEIRYFLYPENRRDQGVNITLRALNNGLIIKSIHRNVDIAINLPYYPINNTNKEIAKIDALFNLDDYFEGYQMDFEYNLVESESMNYSNLVIDRSIFTDVNRLQVEFLSNKIKIIDIFTVGNMNVIFDNMGHISVTPSILKGNYKREHAENILGCIPSYHLNFYNGFLDYQCVYEQDGRKQLFLGLTKITTSIPEGESADEYYKFGDYDLYIKIMMPTIKLSKRIRFSFIYIYNQNQIRLAATFDIPDQNYASVVQFIDAEFDRSKKFKVINKEEHILTAKILGTNQFKVNSLIFIQKCGSYVAIGIQNFGFLIYNVDKDQVLSMISLIPYMQNEEFIVTKIIEEDNYNLHILMNRLGVISIRYESIDDFRINQKTKQPNIQILKRFNLLENEYATSRHVAFFDSGFAFFTLQTQATNYEINNYKQYNIRFFSYSYSSRSKLLAARILPLAEECILLRAYPLSFAEEYFNFQPQINQYMLAFYCNSELYFYYFSSVFKLQFIHSHDWNETGTQYEYHLNLTAFNDFSSENIQFNLQTYRNYFPYTKLILIVYAIFIGIFIFLIQYKFQKNKEVKKNEERQETQQSSSKNQRFSHESSASLQSSSFWESSQSLIKSYGYAINSLEK